jgi:hypothetical protein
MKEQHWIEERRNKKHYLNITIIYDVTRWSMIDSCTRFGGTH